MLLRITELSDIKWVVGHSSLDIHMKLTEEAKREWFYFFGWIFNNNFIKYNNFSESVYVTLSWELKCHRESVFLFFFFKQKFLDFTYIQVQAL